jgi:hypothetical protein
MIIIGPVVNIFHVIPVCPDVLEVLLRNVIVTCLQKILKMLSGMTFHEHPRDGCGVFVMQCESHVLYIALLTQEAIWTKFTI